MEKEEKSNGGLTKIGSVIIRVKSNSYGRLNLLSLSDGGNGYFYTSETHLISCSVL